MHPQSPDRESPLSPSLREQVERLCKRFEGALQAGEKPQIEAWLVDAPFGARRTALLELARLEYEFRRLAGEQPGPEEYLERFPDLADSASSFSGESLLGTQTRTTTFRPDGSQPERPDLPRPERVGRYEIRELLGRGAFGAVYLGWDPQLKREVALKIPRLRSDEENEQIEAFLEEARRAVQLERHQGIVPVYDVGREGNVCYIVSQYLAGGTLAQRLKHGPLPLGAALELAITLADIVHFAHCQGWVHRDIKPSNILLDNAGRPYLADFGLTSRLEEMRSADSPPHGTPSYMAPELAREALAQIRHEVVGAALRPDQRSDVYSLGVLLYQMLTGRLPFEAERIDDLFDLVVHSDPVPLRLASECIPTRLEAVCLKALAKNPNDRYLTAADLRDELKVVSAALANAALPRVAVDPAWWRHSPGRVAALLGTGILLGLLLIVVFYQVAGHLWQRPIEHTSPGGETNVAQLEPRSAAMDRATPQMDRERLFAELSALLESERSLRKSGVEPPPGELRGPGADMPPAKAFHEAHVFGPRIASGNAGLSEELAQKLAQARDQKDREQEFSLLLRATNGLLDEGNAVDAETHALTMLRIAAEDKAKRPIAQSQLGLALARQGRYDEAAAHHEQAAAAYREIFNAVKQSPRAEARQGLSHVARMLGLALNRLGNVRKNQSQSDAAEAAFAEARGVLAPFPERESELALVLMNLGALQSGRENFAEAESLLKESVRLAQKTDDRVAEAEALANLGTVQSRAGNDALAIETYARASELLPQNAPYDTRSRLLYNWISALLAERRYEEVREPLEKLRAIARPDDSLAQRILKVADALLAD